MKNCPACGNPLELPGAPVPILKQLENLHALAMPTGQRMLEQVMAGIASLAREMMPDDPGVVGLSRAEVATRLIGRPETPINAYGDHPVPYPE